MTAIESIRENTKRFSYKSMGDAVADLRVLLDEVDRLKNENLRLLASVRSGNYAAGDGYREAR